MNVSAVPLLAVHISDGVLGPAWCAAGLIVMALLMAAAVYRISDEEIVRVALLAAVFFVASLIHVRLGPTSAHLLLNGLVGVLLGLRAALAIPVALFLQAVLIGHGGVYALGVNACVWTLPALAAYGLFHLLHRPTWLRRPGYRAALVSSAVLLWLLTCVFSVVLLTTSRWSGRESLETGPALAWTFSPYTLIAAVAVAVVLARLEFHLDHAPEFPVGLLLGLITVLATTALNAVALVWGGEEDWRTLVLLVFVAHLPIAVLEGLILGFTLGFLARVKPELLGIEKAAHSEPVIESPALPQSVRRSHAVWLALLAALAMPTTVQAHRLDASFRVLPNRIVEIESWFHLDGDPAHGAKVQVLRQDGSMLAQGKVDEKGVFCFEFKDAEPLKVFVNAGAGHRRTLLISKEALLTSGHGGNTKGGTERAADTNVDSPPPAIIPADMTTFWQVCSGIGIILASATIWLVLRRHRRATRTKASPVA